jgi:NADH:ubiquinone oxidoreductase subunit F (NADH-binding)
VTVPPGALFGPSAYSCLTRGTVLATISGAIAVPGVYELAFGTPFADLLAAADGGTEPLQAVLIGGYFGTWIAAAAAEPDEVERLRRWCSEVRGRGPLGLPLGV